LTRLVVGLGVAQIISWAALIYAITVLGKPMAADLGVSDIVVFGAFSASLVVSGLLGPRVGALIDRRGGRLVMVWGSVIAAAALVLLAVAPSLPIFAAAWIAIGVARAMTLYEAAFATLSQHLGTSFRRAVTAVTLFGGFAGTVAFPLSLAGLDTIGWRGAIAGFALAELLICVPLHFWCIPAGPGRHHRTAGQDDAQDGDGDAGWSGPGLAALTLSFALTAFITSAIAAHVVNLLQAAGLATATAVWIASLIGPMQVVGRIVELTFAHRLTAVGTGMATLALLILALLTLAIGGTSVAGALAFAAMYGCANGIQTIVRGTVPAELFGRHGYGTMMGRIARWSFIARALAPLALSLIAALGLAFDPSVALLAAMALAALTAYVVAIRRVASP
jgi:predicted MFS family arabinose efflux permease